ncbi:MAG: VTC domain-containing protein [Chitinispirillaceae bacterium]
MNVATAVKSADTVKEKVLSVETPALLDRFEAKYTIPYSMIDPVVRFIKPYCSYDKHSVLSPDGFYKVNSLYFDTPDYLFLRKRMLKTERRFNMRVRSYGDDPHLPYFFEIKQRIGDNVRKTRGRVDDPDYEQYFKTASKAIPPTGDAKNTEYTDLFFRTYHRYNAGPVVLVQYRRMAFFSNYEEYARVTLDIDLRYMEPEGFAPVPNEGRMCHCDVQKTYDRYSSVILELKCYTSFVPLWMVDLVRTFNLQRTGFSKFSTCLLPIFSRYSLDGLGRSPAVDLELLYSE